MIIDIAKISIEREFNVGMAAGGGEMLTAAEAEQTGLAGLVAQAPVPGVKLAVLLKNPPKLTVPVMVNFNSSLGLRLNRAVCDALTKLGQAVEPAITAQFYVTALRLLGTTSSKTAPNAVAIVLVFFIVIV